MGFSKRLALLTVITTLSSSLRPAWAERFELQEATLSDIQAAFEAEALTSVELVQLYLNRIEAYDSQGPAINALITVNPEALAIAAEMDTARAAGEIMGPLHGIPVILKDNFNTVDLPTTAGSAVLAEAIPLTDAFVVQQLRAAGAIILAKANMSEFAASYGRLGYSSMGGLTLNPYNLGRDASGSSSGTAAAIAANFAVLGTGSDTAGSIRGPAAVAGLVGIKPTLGLTSRSGIVPLTLSFDVVGPMARTVTDAAIALGVMAAPDPADPVTLSGPSTPIADYTQFLDADALSGARIGLVQNFLGGNPRVDALTAEAIAQIEGLGATVVPIDLPEALDSPWTYMTPAWDNEFKFQIEAYLATLPDPFPQTLPALIEASQVPAIADSATPMNPARLESLEAALEASGLADPGLLYNLTYELPRVRQLLLEAMAENSIDALIYPTMACPASPIYTVEADPTYVCSADDPYEAGYLANLSGFPDITVPMGFTEAGLPIGLSFMAEAYSEPKLLGFAFAYEQASLVRQPPATTPALSGEVIDY
ncbi:amidase family protein [Nodosilinea sp. P-1105]|uniref:amidase family protein n=1 Tax=Nodosilinea sp. P-1105 TaxID=2546229 RepID=UPI00146B9167|nr:amidase family protein [Nodosilinea sp. P-1105]NMF82862.1 amidase [Nodosilinea sp. P-1105]